ncbi:MAG: amidohydrolase family protein [Chloroflexi bacterium]|nr:amidohydrolase family protein [Chloroflexota bacterium]
MTTIIKNATIVTGDAGRTVLHDSAIAVDADRITAVGATNDLLASNPGAEQIDGSGKSVFPGLVNCHTHLLATADRGILEDFGFPTTLRFPVTTRSLLTPEERQVMAVLGALEAIRSGTTCLLEIQTGVQGYAGNLADTGMRLVLADSINDVDESKVRDRVFEFSDSRLDQGLQRSADLIQQWHGKEDGRVTCFMAPHAPETCSPGLLRRSREMAETHDIGYTIHLSQSTNEVEAVMGTRGVLPTQYLFANGLLGPRLVTAHCRYVNSAEVALLGGTHTAVSNNAAIAARRGAAAPVKELQAAGCAIGMGSDNMAEDMVEVMRAGLFLERVRRNDQMDPQPEDVLEWATRGGARILGLGDETGTLEVGKKADLFVVDMMRPHLVPTLRAVSSFVHNGQPADITSVMVDGKWVMRDGKVLTVDEADIVQRAEKIGHSVWRRLLDRYPNVPFPVTLPSKG